MHAHAPDYVDVHPTFRAWFTVAILITMSALGWLVVLAVGYLVWTVAT